MRLFRLLLFMPWLVDMDASNIATYRSREMSLADNDSGADDAVALGDAEDAYILRYAQLLKKKWDDDVATDADATSDVGADAVDSSAVDAWSADGAVHHSVLQTLMELQPMYRDDDFSHAEAVQRTIDTQQALKQRVDAAFHKEMHTYHKGALHVVPGMLDLCDALDDSFDECCETSETLDKCRLSVSISVKLIALNRRRHNLRLLRDAMDSIQAWTLKVETIITKLQQRDFRTAIVMLGARMYSESGSPLLSRDKFASANRLPVSTAQASNPQPQAFVAKDDSTVDAAKPAVAEGDASATPQKRLGRQRSTTIAYMAHSHAASRPLPASAPRTQQEAVSPERQASTQSKESGDRDRRRNDFTEGIGGVCAATVVGRTALAAYFELKENGTELVVHSLKAEVHHLLAEEFAPNRFFRVVGGLFALKVRGDSTSRFFLDCIEPMISDAMRQALVDVVGEDAGETWEAVADTLVPSEFHECTVQVLAKLTSVLRSILKVQQFCTAVVEREEKRASEASLNERSEIVLAACRFLSTIGVQTLQKCLASVVLYAMQTKLTRGPLEDALHVYRLLHMFVSVCEDASSDGAAQSTRSSLRFQCMRLIRDEYLQSYMEPIVKVMQDDMFLPFPASADDFPSLFPYVLREDGDNVALFAEYLKLPPLSQDVLAMPLAAAIDSADAVTSRDPALPVAYDGAVNPFFMSTAVDPGRTPAVAASSSSLQLFDNVPLFTFSSFMVCKKMMEIATTVVQLGDASMHLVDCVSYLASVYTWFVLTHFVASTESIGLDVDNNVPSGIRDYAKRIKEWTAYVPPPAGYPLFPGSVCHMWKSRAGMTQCQNAAQERITAICSLESVVICHRLVVCALTPLLPPDALIPVASVSEALAGTAKYAVAHGLRRVGLNILPPESIAGVIERHNYTLNGSAQPDGDLSQAFKYVADQLHNIHLRLKESHREMPFIAAQKLLEHVVFIACCAIVEGVSRIRKINDVGRTMLRNDAAAFCRLQQTLHPTIPMKLFDYVQLFVRAYCASFSDGTAFIQSSHAWYTSKQLLAFGEKEGFMKKREVEQLLSKLQHEDRLPLHLLEGN